MNEVRTTATKTQEKYATLYGGGKNDIVLHF